MLSRKQKKLLRNTYKRLFDVNCDWVVSMQEVEHKVSRDCTTWYFGLYDPSCNSAIDIENDLYQQARDSRAALPAWDCSGCFFLSHYSVHVNPCGLISVVVCYSQDV